MKILKRNAKMNAQTDVIGPPKEQDIPLNIPKKTQLYVDQTERERKQAVDLHRQFQKDLCKLRLKAAQAYVKTIQDGQAPIASSNSISMLLNALIRVLGPIFHIKLCLQVEWLQALPPSHSICRTSMRRRSQTSPSPLGTTKGSTKSSTA